MIKSYQVQTINYSGWWYIRDYFDTFEDAIAYVEANLKGEKVIIKEGIMTDDCDIMYWKEKWTQEATLKAPHKKKIVILEEDSEEEKEIMLTDGIIWFVGKKSQHPTYWELVAHVSK